jgi:hypothetical protein
MNKVIYKITVESFVWKDEVYNVAMSPQLCFGEDGLEVIGSYVGLIIDPDTGTIQFTLTPDTNGGWDVTPKGKIDPNIMDEIDKIISKIENGTSREF